MKVLDKGHLFELQNLGPDGLQPYSGDTQVLQFVKRVGENYPGNEEPEVEGTTTQEVIRALISRTLYVNNQIKFFENELVLEKLRSALWWLEFRAAKVRGSEAVANLPSAEKPEEAETCLGCGHTFCKNWDCLK